MVASSSIARFVLVQVCLLCLLVQDSEQLLNVLSHKRRQGRDPAKPATQAAWKLPDSEEEGQAEKEPLWKPPKHKPFFEVPREAGTGLRGECDPHS